ncbi:bifunctional phosphopantothenoylcysteine decarboxylase/phosphopantothenate--cysteine ligase CoaBC [Hoeflea prorocentri]|uniref:Coenzyme A biosynthesis bifunctional protein CoaBC n=1 Tax=Hoeflea prorocentri TaxID=1922333 RepID=A0A9X3UK61_9HYPH|nr:bifunctional phosphopantothenoylcysteine decarboxylase/phosphopantothenate--cysteine ligase CoaBC [Hoeflea prorocentri]MCY6382833.1 bifunctional phosphopantothenoylcysteine decarboxylase/phosphopantothenate--cysteine ligase CoaBC [Hoeflea prorocentri]MDA5400633.1 bifunctional phosphopantothenoylcysteine decarboxylase/phosphopantothenate--cysteine ligase CoaBC [Hoeflea prorocentri]
MASITIRNLDDATKQSLRERAARNGRSMEEEVRHLLRDASVTEVEASTEFNPQEAVVDGILADKDILLIITGGIAAYKSLDLIRRLRERGANVRPIMTKGAMEFITPLSVGALCADHVFTELFSREDEQDVGHIRLARGSDLIIVAPATADFIAKAAHGLADDLASTVILASDRPILIAPAMNPVMWSAPAQQRNIKQVQDDGAHIVGPASGEMAESGEAGKGRMAEPLDIVAAAARLLDDRPKPLSGKTAIVTSGPTHEPIDPVRYIANRSSGKQGHAIAAALASLGARVTLVSGPVTIGDPPGVSTVHVESAREMLKAVEKHLPADIAVMVAAVADWRTAGESGEKIKKKKGEQPPALKLTENPDILKTVGHHQHRPGLVVGFAAETQNLIDNARAKLERKGADFIVANDVSPETGIMGGDRNNVRIVTADGVEDWPEMDKRNVANRLAQEIARRF